MEHSIDHTHYGSLHVHLAYSLTGENYHVRHKLTDGPYAVPSFSDYSRDVLKRALLISFAAASKRSAMGAIRSGWQEDFERDQYEGIDLNALLEAYPEKHNVVLDIFLLTTRFNYRTWILAFAKA